MARSVRVVGAVGSITRLFSLAFLLPAGVAAWYDVPDVHVAGLWFAKGIPIFLGCALGTFLLGTWMHRIGKGDDRIMMRDRDAYLTVGLGWLFLCVLAMVPFMLEGVLLHPVDAFFEAMSGMTTTGATVIARDLDLVPPSILIWRALLQFIGGMGIIVLSVAVLSRLTQGGDAMLQAESPGPSMQRIAPRIAQSARILWIVYASFAGVLFSILMCIMLWRHQMAFDVALYEALLHTFTTISTGGFAAHTESISYFHDWLLELVIIVFMLVSGTNFTLHYALIRGKGRSLLRDPEWRFYMATYLVVTLAVTGILWRAGMAIGPALRDSAFTVASLITSTGLTTADFDVWPAAAKFLLFLVMVTGASAGSTGGGLKHIRVLLLFKIIKQRMLTIIHPRAVKPIQLGGRTIPEKTLMATVAFFFAFVGVWLAGTLLLSFDPAFINPVDAASASISALSNMGPGLGVVGPTQNYAALSSLSKLLLAFEEWFGRLEIFAAILVFTPETWKH